MADKNFGDDFYSIIDDNGDEFSLEHLDTLEYKDELYMAFTPADMDEDDPDYGLIILKVVEEDGEELFASIDDDDEREAVHKAFMEQLFEGEDEDE